VVNGIALRAFAKFFAFFAVSLDCSSSPILQKRANRKEPKGCAKARKGFENEKSPFQPTQPFNYSLFTVYYLPINAD